MPSSIPPEGIVGLLADGDRLRVFAALVLGHETVAEVCRATDLTNRAVAASLVKLVDGGLVAKDGAGYHLLENALRSAARDALHRADPKADTDGDDADRDRLRVLRAFMTDGRVDSIPTAHGKRAVILDLLAQDFEPGRRYSEEQVNQILGDRHADTAALRRYLVDEGFLERDRGGGRYWRSGGTFDPDRGSRS